MNLNNKALYRKKNCGGGNSSTYHKKDGTNYRAILKDEAKKLVLKEVYNSPIKTSEL